MRFALAVCLSLAALGPAWAGSCEVTVRYKQKAPAESLWGKLGLGRTVRETVFQGRDTDFPRCKRAAYEAYQVVGGWMRSEPDRSLAQVQAFYLTGNRDTATSALLLLDTDRWRVADSRINNDKFPPGAPTCKMLADRDRSYLFTFLSSFLAGSMGLTVAREYPGMAGLDACIASSLGTFVDLAAGGIEAPRAQTLFVDRKTAPTTLAANFMVDTKLRDAATLRDLFGKEFGLGR